MRRQQTGTVLAVSMMLLTILTLLAISTMTTATTELVMSSNDQYRQRAMQAAETGIERTIASAPFMSITTQTTATALLPDGDQYTATIRPRGTTAAPAGYLPTFTAAHFEIDSTGLSHRGARTTHIQGLFVVQPLTTPTVTDPASTPPRCLTGIEIHSGQCAAVGTVVRTYWRTGSHVM